MFEANAHLRKLKVERAELEERRNSDKSRVGLHWNLKIELAGTTERRCPRELGCGLNQRASLGDQSAASGTSGAQKRIGALKKVCCEML